jgi:hypothetical protein
MNGQTNDSMSEHDVPPNRFFPIAVRLLEQYRTGIIDAIERCKSTSSATKDEHMIAETEFHELSKRLKNVDNEIWYLKNI